MKLAAVEPEVIPRSIARVLPATQEFSPPYLGVLEGGKGVAVNELPWWLARRCMRWCGVFRLLVYVSLVLVVVVSAPLALLAALGWARPSRTQHGTELLLAMLLGGVAAYSLATAAFGDGMSEAARHFIPGSLAVYAAWIALVVRGCRRSCLRWIAAPTECDLRDGGSGGRR